MGYSEGGERKTIADSSIPTEGSRVPQADSRLMRQMDIEIRGSESPVDIELARDSLLGLVYALTELTDLEPLQLENYDAPRTTSTANSAVEPKALLLLSLPLIRDHIIPSYMLGGENTLNFDDETLLLAPWVPLIHAWNEVLNQMKVVAAIQKGEVEEPSRMLVSVSRELFKLTTHSSGELHNREEDIFRYNYKLWRDGAVDGYKEYTETKKRKLGVKGVNPSRSITLGELHYILSTLIEVYPKEVNE